LSYFELFSIEFLQNQLKSTQFGLNSYSINIQSIEYARGRRLKRPRALPLPSTLSTDDSFSEDSDLAQILPRKRTRKASQLPQIEVYQDQTFEKNSHGSELSKEPTPAASGRPQEKIWPHIAVEIPFRLDIHINPIGTASQRGSRVPLASLGSIAINGTRKAPKIPANWLKSQPNDHTSTFF